MTKKKVVVNLKVNYVPLPPEKVQAFREGMLILLDLIRKKKDSEKEKIKMPQTG